MHTNYQPELLTAHTAPIHLCRIRRYDLPAYGEALFNAWRQLDRQARDASSFCFPAWCHFELLDRDGNIIFTSESELLGTDDADIRSTKIPLLYQSANLLAPILVTRRAWRPEVAPDDIPAHLRLDVAKVNIYVRSTVDIPEWEISVPAADLIESFTYHRIIMSRRAETDAHLYRTVTLKSEKSRPSRPANYPTTLLLRRPRHKRQPRKLLHSRIRRITVTNSPARQTLTRSSLIYINNTSLCTPVAHHSSGRQSDNSRLPPAREPPDRPVPILSDE